MTTTPPDPDKPKPSIEFKMASSLMYVENVHTNVGQVVMTTTEDKIRLCLHDHLKTIESRQGWIAPLGVAITIFVTLLTSDFKDKFGIKKEAWQSFFLTFLVISVAWLIASLFKLGRRHTMDDIIRDLQA